MCHRISQIHFGPVRNTQPPRENTLSGGNKYCCVDGKYIKSGVQMCRRHNGVLESVFFTRKCNRSDADECKRYTWQQRMDLSTWKQWHKYKYKYKHKYKYKYNRNHGNADGSKWCLATVDESHWQTCQAEKQWHINLCWCWADTILHTIIATNTNTNTNTNTQKCLWW